MTWINGQSPRTRHEIEMQTSDDGTRAERRCELGDRATVAETSTDRHNSQNLDALSLARDFGAAGFRATLFWQIVRTLFRIGFAGSLALFAGRLIEDATFDTDGDCRHARLPRFVERRRPVRRSVRGGRRGTGRRQDTNGAAGRAFPEPAGAHSHQTRRRAGRRPAALSWRACQPRHQPQRGEIHAGHRSVARGSGGGAGVMGGGAHAFSRRSGHGCFLRDARRRHPRQSRGARESLWPARGAILGPHPDVANHPGQSRLAGRARQDRTADDRSMPTARWACSKSRSSTPV